MQTEVAETQEFFEIQVIDLDRPTLLVEFQGFLGRQAGVSTEAVLGAGVPGAFFGENDVDFLPHLFEASAHRADVVGGCAAVAYSLQRDLLVRLVLERLVVAVDTLLLDFAIGFEDTNDVPLLAQAEIDQFGRGIPGIEQHIHLAAGRQQPLQLLLAGFVDQIYRPGTFPKEICQRFGMDTALQQTRQVAERFALIADDQGIHDLQQMSDLRLVKCKL